MEQRIILCDAFQNEIFNRWGLMRNTKMRIKRAQSGNGIYCTCIGHY